MRALGRAVCAGVLWSAAICWPQKPPLPQWQKLLQKKQLGKAHALCIKWPSSTKVSQRVEAYKCLANFSLRNNEVLRLEGGEAGGGVLAGAYTAESVDAALSYLQKGLELAPQDISIHQGRLHLLEGAFRFEEMATALDESCRIYEGKDGLDAWIIYTSELFEDRQYSASLGLLKVLLKYFPNSHDVAGNTGSIYMALDKDDQALPYLRRAVEIAPDDSIDAWNLGRVYDFMGQTKHADTWYQKALKLKWENARNFQASRCVYARFVVEKLNDVERGCRLERADCPTDEQTACSKQQ